MKDGDRRGESVDEVHEPLRIKDREENESTPRDGPFLYFCALSVGLSLLSIGASAVWTSPMMKHLKSSDPSRNPLSRPITTYEVSILSGMMPVGCLVGPTLIETMSKHYGRKFTLLFYSFCNALSFVIIAFARSVNLYYLSRFLVGISMSLVGYVPVFSTEITENHNRGKFGVALSIFIPIGNLYGTVIGPFLSLRTFSLLCALPVILSVILVAFFVPESPVYLTMIGKRRKAIESLRKFRNRSASNVETDYLQMEKTLKMSQIDDLKMWSLLKDRCFRRTFAVAVWLNVLQLGTGILVIMAFMGPIFDEAKISLSGDSVAVIVILVKISFFFIASTIVERIGRRPLLLVSSLGTTIALFNLGLYFHLKSVHFAHLDSITLLPVVSIVLFFVTYASGLGPVPQVLSTELFHGNVRTLAISMTMILVSIFLCVQSFGFPIVQEALGTATCFWIFSGTCFLAFVYIYKVVPETKGKDIAEIQNMFS